MQICIPTLLSDTELVAELLQFAGREREARAQLVAHLAELDARKLYLGAVFSSLFAYCCEVLRLSEHESYNRIEAARAARRFPVVLTLRGRLASPWRRRRSRRLPVRSGPSQRQCQCRQPPHRRRQRGVLSSLLFRPSATRSGSLPVPTRATSCAWPRILLRHAVPSGDAAEIVDRALTALLEQLARRKLAAVKSAQRRGSERETRRGSRHVPAAVKRAVWLRDGGRCAFVATAGRRCRESGFLEFHHVLPYGVGGEATAGNIELRCRAHNAYEAELFYGPAKGTSAARSGTSRWAAQPSTG